MLGPGDRSADGREGLFDKHVLSYHWDDFVPRLEYYDLNDQDIDELPLDRLALEVSPDRRCVGRFDGDSYRPCPRHRRVRSFTVCRECASDWLPVQKCVFEPQCTGDGCDHPEFCGRKHFVYLASYGRLLKVGMTSAGRLKERAIEQGADAVRPLFECSSRQEARMLEKETSARFKIPQDIRIDRIARQWTARPVREEMTNVQVTYLRRIARWRPPLDAEIVFLPDYPVSELPRSPPRVAEPDGPMRGKVLGVKGRFMIFRPEGREESRLLDLRGLEGHYIRLLDR
jgi:hypothetical protein